MALLTGGALAAIGASQPCNMASEIELKWHDAKQERLRRLFIDGPNP